MKYRLKTDINGNRCIVIKPENERGFSIQTNGNCPHLHSDALKTKNGKYIPDAWSINEILHYVADNGTERQKQIMPLPSAPAI